MLKAKGNLLVGQSGGPSAVINSSLCGIIEEAIKKEEIGEIIGMKNGIQGLLKEDLIDLRRQNPDVIKGLKRTPTMALGSCRYKLKEQEYDDILKIIAKYNIRYFLYIGGNDSMHTTHEIGRLAKEKGYELYVIGVPKTIDNDLLHNDHTPGYGSAARYNAIMATEICMDTISLKYIEVVKVVETMGRNSGWVTAATALAGKYSPHLIYIPEIPFNAEKFLNDVKTVYDYQGYVVIAACEGLKNPNGSFVAAFQSKMNIDPFGNPELGGLGQYLVDLIVQNLGLKTRLDKPGTMQRSSGSAISKVDADEAYMVGAKAVNLAISYITDKTVTLVRTSNSPYSCETGLANLEDVAIETRKMPPEFIKKDQNNITKAFIEYAAPLIGCPIHDYVELADIKPKL
jgi:6-phosphofructokinase 1